MSGLALSTVLGNEPIRLALIRALENKTLPHAVLLSAPEGCGRNYWARCLAADYLFPSGGEGAKAVLRGESSEVLSLAGEGLSGLIKIDRIREVRKDMYRTGLSSQGRVVLIRDAERMMAPAANALLKVLEEPPGEVLFILTACDASALLQTIRSRCALYPLAEVSLSEAQDFLQSHGANPTQATRLTDIYAGRPGLGLRVLTSPQREQTLSDAQAAAQAVALKDFYGLLCLFSAYEGRKEEEKAQRTDFLFDFSCVLSAAMHGRLSRQADPLSLAQATRVLPFVQQARLDLQANISPKLVFASLAIHLIEESL